MNTTELPPSEPLPNSLLIHSEAPTTILRKGPQIAVSDSYDDEPKVDLEKLSEGRQKAFSARFQFAGQALQPFSITRERLLLDIRSASGAGEFGRMDSLFGDGLRFVWLCLHDGEQLERFQSGAGLPGLSSWPLYRRFQMAIDRWTDQNSELVRKHRDDIVDTFLDAWKANQITHAVPETSDHNAEDDEAGN